MSKVVVLRTSNNVNSLIKDVERIMDTLNFKITKGESVLLKPNCFSPKKNGVTTNVKVIEAVIKYILRSKGVPIIGEGVPVSRNVDYLFKKLGVSELANKYGIRLVNIDTYDYKIVKVPNGIANDEFKISKIVFEVDKIINLPVMKTHNGTLVTLGMKNLKGTLPSDEKFKCHLEGLHESIVDLNSIVKPDLTIIDGITALEGNGPANGKSVRMNLILGSRDVVSVDSVASSIMGINPKEVKHIYLASKKGLGEMEKVEIIGEKISDVKRDFVRPSTFSGLYPHLVNLMGRLFRLASKLGIDTRKMAIGLDRMSTPYPTPSHSCQGCKKCIKNCPVEAITISNGKRIHIDRKKCIKCLICTEVCDFDQIRAVRFARLRRSFHGRDKK